MKEVKLTQGKVSIVDDEDFAEVSRMKWCLLKGPSGNGYARCHKRGTRNGYIALHHFIMKSEQASCEIDHINGNSLDNRKSNLRFCSRSDNAKNRKPWGRSQYMGVTLRENGKWLAKININGKQVHLGVFIEEADAALAFDKAAIKTGNSFYRLNFP